MRIGRIGADHIQVSIRPAVDDAELLALVGRLERLIGAGYDSIDVVFDEPGSATSARGPEQIREHITRHDVAERLLTRLREPDGRQDRHPRRPR